MIRILSYSNNVLCQVRTHMAAVGVRRFQELVGRTDLLKVREHNDNPKARLLNLSLILKNALHMRPGVNIHGGSKAQVQSGNLSVYHIKSYSPLDVLYAVKHHRTNLM